MNFFFIGTSDNDIIILPFSLNSIQLAISKSHMNELGSGLRLVVNIFRLIVYFFLLFNYTDYLFVLVFIFILYSGVRLSGVIGWKFQTFRTPVRLILRVAMLQNSLDSHHTMILDSLIISTQVRRSLELLHIFIIVLQQSFDWFPLD